MYFLSKVQGGTISRFLKNVGGAICCLSNIQDDTLCQLHLPTKHVSKTHTYADGEQNMIRVLIEKVEEKAEPRGIGINEQKMLLRSNLKPATEWVEHTRKMQFHRSTALAHHPDRRVV